MNINEQDKKVMSIGWAIDFIEINISGNSRFLLKLWILLTAYYIILIIIVSHLIKVSGIMNLFDNDFKYILSLSLIAIPLWYAIDKTRNIRREIRDYKKKFQILEEELKEEKYKLDQLIINEDIRGSHFWHEIRREVLKRDNYTCQKCKTRLNSKAGQLHIHHKVPISEGGSNDKDNLVTFCFSCHNKIHPWLQDRNENELNTIGW